MPPKHFIVEAEALPEIFRKVAEAKRLLQRRELSITEVAQAVGYGDYAYFSRVFKKLTGISPRQYREAGDDG